MTRPHADSFFHFTGSPENTYGILREGFHLRYCLERVRDWYPSVEESVAIPMVCFCDLPISRLARHLERYSGYGIGMKRDWGLHVGLAPVLYVTDRTQVAAALNAITIRMGKLTDETDRFAGYRDVRALSSLVKPIHGLMERGGRVEKVDFYDEAEWRGLMTNPLLRDFLKEEEFRDASRRALANNAIKNECSLQFFPFDINYIFVPSDAELPKMVRLIDRLAEEREYSAEQRSLLYARLTTVDQLIRDA